MSHTEKRINTTKKISFLFLLILTLSFPLPILAGSDTPAPDPISITLQIETANNTLLNKTLAVSACPPFPESNTNTVNGFCALEQSGLTNVWTWYGEDAFLDSINGIANDSSTNSYWTWFSNLELGSVALNKHQLVANEKLLLTIDALPLKIEVSNTSPEIHTATKITVLKFSFDSNFNPVWLPASGSTVHVGSQTITPNETGVATFTATTTDTFDVYATEINFLPTAHITLTPLPSTVVETPAPTATPSSGGGNVAPPKGNPTAALTFLLQNQQDGSFGSPLHNDWVAIALSSADMSQESLDALIPHLLQSNKFTTATDYERHAMALQAVGVNPYSVTGIIQGIISSFDGVQIGDPRQINDDIFSLFPLLHAGYTKDDDIIKKEIDVILSAQDGTGAWGSVDLTSAAIQALAPLSDMKGVSEAIAKARGYLVTRQDSDGCFGNIYSTSWAIQAIIALEESPLAWTAWGGSTPLSCMALLQAPDGGFGPMEATIGSRVWATAYAIPALKEKSWNTILKTFPKQTITTKPVEVVFRDVASTTTSVDPGISEIVVSTSTEKVTTPVLTSVKKQPRVPTETLSPPQSNGPITAANSSPTLLDAIGKYVLILINKAVSLIRR